MSAQMSVKTETRTTLVSDFHDFLLECAVHCKLTIDVS